MVAKQYPPSTDGIGGREPSGSPSQVSVELWSWDRQTDRWTAASLNAPLLGHNKCQKIDTVKKFMFMSLSAKQHNTILLDHRDRTM